MPIWDCVSSEDLKTVLTCQGSNREYWAARHYFSIPLTFLVNEDTHSNGNWCKPVTV